MAFGNTIVAAVLGGPSAPADSNTSANGVVEGAAVNTTVGITASSSDPGGGAITYSLSADSSGGGFKIDPATGVVSVADSSKIDFETPAGHAYTVTVRADNSHGSSSQTFTIPVTDVAPAAPVDSNGATNTVAEGAANGSTVGVTAFSTDINGPAVTYALVGDTSGGGFTINSTTGVVTVADSTKLDYETTPGHAYTVTAQASDGTLTNSQAFTIAVTDVAPTALTDINGAANTVAEGAANGSTVGITASSVDPNGPATSYSLTDSAGGRFAINSSTGIVTVANGAAIDFETAAGHAYGITVQATNGALTTSTAFSIGVSDVAPSTPVDSDAASDAVTEGAANGSTVGITASSTDVNGPAVTYSLTGDTSGGGFTINSVTGVVTVADSTKINYETAPGHAYTVTTQASDGTLTNSQTFTIAVSDVAPSAPVDSDGATNTVAEGAANGSTVGVTAFSTDINGPGVTYSLVGDTSGGGFTINSTTGVVTVADSTKLDYETTPGHAYTVTAQASDGTLTNSQAFTIALTDVAPTAPTDVNGAANTVAEGAANGSTVGITALSVDPNGPATSYSLTDSAGGRFAIDSSTGIVTVANGAAIDFETAAGHAYGITVQATNGALTTSSAFSIGVTDVAPSAPTDSNGAADSVFEGAANGTVVGITASSTDPGGGPLPTYTLTDNAGGRFAIDGNTGIVTVANGAAIDFETAPGPGHSYGITVQSTAGALSSTHTFSIAVGDVNEAPAGTDKTVTMLEGASYTFSVADFGFSDPGDSVNPNSLLAVKMTTVPGGGTGTFTNNGVTVNAGDSVSAADIAAGHLVFAPALNANGSPEATFTFQVQDNGGTANGGVDTDQSANTISFNVTSVNDAPDGTDTTIASVGAHTFAASEFGFTDPVDAGSAHGADSFQAVIITTLPDPLTGDLKLNGVAVNAGDSIAVSDIGGLVFTPVGSNPATFTFQVRDNGGLANGGVDTDQSPNSFTIQQNAPPVIDSNGGGATAAISAAENQTVVTTVHATDPDNQPSPVSYSIVPGDDGAKFGIDAGGHLTFLSAPNFENPTDVGDTAANNTYVVTVRASDGASFDDQTITVTVTNVNEAPTAVADTTLAVEAGGLGNGTAGTNPTGNVIAGTTSSGAASAPDSDPDAGDTLTVQGIAAGSTNAVLTTNVGSDVNGSFGKLNISSTGAYTYTVDNTNATVQALRQSTDTLTDTFSYTIKDAAGLTSTTQVTVTIDGANDNPVANADAANVTEAGGTANGTPGTNITSGFNVLTGAGAGSVADTDVDTHGETQAVTGVETGTHLSDTVTTGANAPLTGLYGTLTLNTDGSYTYSVDNTNGTVQGLNTGSHVDDVFTYTMQDAAGAKSTTTLTIHVNGANDAPVATADSYIPNENRAFTVTAATGVLANDTDVDTAHGSLTAILNAGPSHAASFTLNSDGSFSYTPATGYLGGDSFTYHTSDGSLTSGVVTVSLDVQPLVWHIDNTASASGEDGSAAHPFHSIAAFNAANAAAGTHPDIVYLHNGTGTYTEADGINLNNGQSLVGQGSALTYQTSAGAPGGAHTVTLIAADPAHTPTIVATAGDGIDLAQDNTVQGLNIGNTSGIGISDNGGTVGALNISNVDINTNHQAVSFTHGGALNVTLDSITSTGGTSGIALGGALTGSFTGTSGTLSGHSGTEFDVSGGSANVSYAGTIADGSGNTSVSIVNKTGGTVTLSGTITDGADTGGGIAVSGNANTTVNFTGTAKTLNTGSGDGVSMTNNTGTSNVNFTGGGLDIDTTNGTGFQATVAGTYSVTGTGNSITTNGNGAALNLSSIVVGAGGITFDSTSSTNSTGTAVAISGVTGGAIALGTGSISGSDGDAFRVGDGAGTANTGGTSAITYSGSISKTDGTGQAVDIQDRAAGAGNITLSGNITHNLAANTGILLDDNAAGTITFSGASKAITSTTATAVNLTDNAGATIAFTNGGLVINSTSGNGFNATGAGPAATTGGTVTVEGSGNTIASTTGTALNVANTTIGANELTFQSISANGAASGIVLNNTGTSGGLNVTGTGAASRDGTGGTITGSTGNGVSLTNTSQVSLTHMNINNSGINGIAGSQVNGFVSDWNSLTGNGNAVNEGGIRFGGTLDTDPTGLTGGAVGTATETRIDHTLITTSFEHGLVVENTSGTLTQLNLTGTTIQNDGNGSGFLIETRGAAGSTAAATVQIEGSSFLNNPGAGVQGNALRNTTLTMNILGNAAPGTNTFTGHDTILLGNGDTGHLVADIRNNTISGNGNGIFVGNAVSATSGATLSAKIVSNNVTTNAGGANHSISSFLSGGTSHLLIDGNTVVNNGQANGINVGTPDDPSGPNFTAIVTNNTVTGGATAANGISLAADVSGPGATAVFKVEGNTVNWSASNVNNLDGIFMNQFGTSTISLERGISASNVASTVLANNNPNAHASAGGPAIEADGTITIVANGTITLPLLAALGGVAAATPAQAASTGEYHLTQAELDSVVAAAIAQWAAAGASASQIAALHATTFSVADLSDNTVGAESSPSHITIDVDAGGHGWFVDPTPSSNSEFTHAANAAGTDLFTDPSNAAAGHLDLLTTVSHEMGHVLEMPDLTAASDAHDLMYIDLVDGERRLPDAGDVPVATATPLTPAIALGPVVTPTMVTGTAGNDIIDAGHGGKNLVGGAGADHFVFANVDLHAATPPPLTHVADYSFIQGDSFDFSALTSAFHGSGVSDALVVRAVEDASGSFATLQLNVTSDTGGGFGSMLGHAVAGSGAHWVNVAQLDGAHAGDDVSVLIDTSAVHAAHLHVGLLA